MANHNKKPSLTELVEKLDKAAPPPASDPIEAAKMVAPGVPAVQAQEAQHPSTEEPILPPPPPAPRTSKTFVVSNSGPISVSSGMQMLRFSPGDEISEDSYGDGAIERFRNAGVSLEEKK